MLRANGPAIDAIETILILLTLDLSQSGISINSTLIEVGHEKELNLFLDYYNYLTVLSNRRRNRNF